MKNLKIIVAALAMIALAPACQMNQRHVVIAEDTDNKYLKIEYAGRAFFNYDSTAIAKITPNGFVKYKRDNEAFVAESDNSGKITYQMNGGAKQTQLNANDKIFLAQAVKDMIKRGHNND
jgi:hypothetical protein